MPSYDEKVAFQLSSYANLASGTLDEDLEGVLRERVQRSLEENQHTIGDWELVWGPGIARFRSDLYAVNALYVVRSAADPRRYVIAVAGTNGPEPFEWLFENFLIRTVAWHPLRPLDRITLGTAIGLNILTRIAPSGDRPSAGLTLREFFAGLADKDIEVTVTGHSLGGALAPALALWLRDAQNGPAGWDPRERASVSALATAGPTPGNRRFAAYLTGRLASVRRYWNDLDVAPRLWAAASLAEAKGFYTAQGLPCPARWFFDLAAVAGLGVDFGHVDPAAAPFPGVFRGELTDPAKTACENWSAQVYHQHTTAYREFFHLDGAVPPSGPTGSADALLSPGLRRLFERTGRDVPPALRDVPARTGPATVPLGGRPADLPASDNDTAAIDRLTGRVAADLTADPD